MKNIKKPIFILLISIMISFTLTPMNYKSKYGERLRIYEDSGESNSQGFNFSRTYSTNNVDERAEALKNSNLKSSEDASGNSKDEYLYTFKISDETIEEKITLRPIWNSEMKVGFKKYEKSGIVYLYKPNYILLVFEIIIVMAILFLISSIKGSNNK